MMICVYIYFIYIYIQIYCPFDSIPGRPDDMKQPGAQKRLAMEEKKDAARTKLRGWRPLDHGELQCDFVGKDPPPVI